MKYNKGWEKIPENWYRTPVDYGLVQLDLDIVAFVTKYPELGKYCHHRRAVSPLRLTHIFTVSAVTLELSTALLVSTLGTLLVAFFNAETLLEGNNLICFVFEAIKTLAPNFLSTIFSVLEAPLDLITSTLGSTLLNMSCPALTDLTIGGQSFEEGIGKMFPGASKSHGAF